MKPEDLRQEILESVQAGDGGKRLDLLVTGLLNYRAVLMEKVEQLELNLAAAERQIKELAGDSERDQVEALLRGVKRLRQQAFPRVRPRCEPDSQMYMALLELEEALGHAELEAAEILEMWDDEEKRR